MIYQKRPRRGGAAAVALSLAVMTGGAAAAQTTQTSTTTFVIQPKAAPAGEQVALPGQPLWKQTVTSTRAARLDEEAVSMASIGVARSFPAGTKMFGVLAPDGWLYCAVAASAARWWTGDEFSCYQDLDKDGRFDVVRPSGAPFNGIALFVFQPGAPKRLPAPVPYTEIPYTEGPQGELAVTWEVPKKRYKPGQPPPVPTEVALKTGILDHNDRNATIFDDVTGPLTNGQQVHYRLRGSDITVLGATPEGGIRYRVDAAMPAQITPMTMTVYTSTYFYVMMY